MENYKKGDIFYVDNNYAKRAEFCNKNNLKIVEIEPDEKGRRFQIQERPNPTQEELIEQETYKLIQQLRDTDYIASKLSEANARFVITEDRSELDKLMKKYSEILQQRQVWRERVDELQKNLKIQQ